MATTDIATDKATDWLTDKGIDKATNDKATNDKATDKAWQNDKKGVAVKPSCMTKKRIGCKAIYKDSLLRKPCKTNRYTR